MKAAGFAVACRFFAYFRGTEAKARRARVACEGRIAKNPACPHTIVQAVPAFKYERGYLIGYFETCDPRMFFQYVTQSRTVI